MKRLLATMKTDVTVQVRNRLYRIGIGVGVLCAVALALLTGPASLPAAIPPVILLVGGGSALMYVAGLILFEKDEGTLHALVVSPLRTAEYLGAKIVTLNVLGLVECGVLVGGALWLVGWQGPVAWPNVPLLVLGTLALGVLFTLLSIILVVRYDKITDFLLPMAGIAMLLQLPFLYFWGVVEHPAFLLFPTSAPTMLVQGAFVPLPAWKWAYALGFTGVQLAGLTVWAYRAFQAHIIENLR